MTKTNTMTNAFRKHPQRAPLRDLCHLRFLIRVKRRYDLTKKEKMTKTNTIKKTRTKTVEEQPQRTILETCDL